MKQVPLVHVVAYYPPHLGGMENLAKMVAEELSRTRAVDVLTTNCGAERITSLERNGALRIHRLRAREIANVPVAAWLFPRLLLLPRRSIVHVHVAHALVPELVWLSRRLRGGKFVAHFHLDVAPSGRFGRVFVWYKKRILGSTLRAASKVITFSQDQASFIEQTYGVRRDAIAIIPNGIGPEFYSGARKWTTEGRPLRVLYVGRFSQQKALPRLIDALAAMEQPVEALLVGNGGERRLVEARLRERGLTNVRLPGVRQGNDLLRCYRWADVFVLPSDREGMPLAALEALAGGLPIVATDVVGNRELLDGVGVLVPQDAGAMAKALDELAQDVDLQKELSAKSAEAAENYTLQNLVKRIEDLYSEVWTQ